MQSVEIDPDFDGTPPRGRARRAITIAAASLLGVTAASTAFLHPSLPAFMTSPPTRAPVQAAYRTAAVDFIDARTGWVIVLSEAGDYRILHTANAGETWTRQLSGQSKSRLQYLKFFDRSAGVFAVVGTQPILRHTSDGGRTWSTLPALTPSATVASWSFADADHGWMLVHEADRPDPSAVTLYRTEDGGRSWSELGRPVDSPDAAFLIQFSSSGTLWAATAGSGPYAYRSTDSGATWTQVGLPAPSGGWPATGRFFVDVQPTSARGAIASVVAFAPVDGRIGTGGAIRGFPPLQVPFYDGSRPNNYIYPTLIDQVVGGPYGAVQAPRAGLFSTRDNGASWAAIEPPSMSGAIGYFDASNWWWIGSGAWSTSQDGGITWTRLRGIGVVEPLPGSLRVLDRDHAWFASSARPLLEATDDGGAHWRTVLLPAIGDPVYALT